jgi:hypothetical protein
MPLVGFEPTIPVFERAKTFHASDQEATVPGYFFYLSKIIAVAFADCNLVVHASGLNNIIGH